MKDPKELDVRREVGWVDDNFVELVVSHVKGKYQVSVLLNGDVREIKAVDHAIDAAMILDAIEFDVLKPYQRKQGVAV